MKEGPMNDFGDLADKVRVETGSGAYDIFIQEGLLAKAGELIRAHVRSDRALVVSDATVVDLYGDKVVTGLRSAGMTATLLPIPPGEASKSFAMLEEVHTAAIKAGLDRHSPIVALGGGVVGDLAGFAAATYLRGVPLVQIPTSLLAQVDSSVGGKVAINHPMGKNLVGAFYQPAAVIIDTTVLATLPEREIQSGMAEVLKYGIIADAAFFRWLTDNYSAVSVRDSAALTRIIKRCCEIKAAVVNADEREAGQRMKLNFGHTFGHAIEASGGFAKYTHGEAVAIGMRGALRLSQLAGLCSQDTVGLVCQALSAYGLPLSARDLALETVMSFMARDKKSFSGQITWVLTREIGDVIFKNDVPAHLVLEVLAELAA